MHNSCLASIGNGENRFVVKCNEKCGFSSYTYGKKSDKNKCHRNKHIFVWLQTRMFCIMISDIYEHTFLKYSDPNIEFSYMT